MCPMLARMGTLAIVRGSFMSKPDQETETYSEEETKARAEAALKRMLATPHKPQEEVKRGKPKR